MKMLETRTCLARLVGQHQPAAEWDDALSERCERLYDEIIDVERRLRRHARLRREFDDE
ncbi:hypothetical protein [Nocardia tenerifensis]|uniref:hypothetical protein n=1 Tax=Nocardia tenerifensis TaxID=228006 RepID=UPI0012F6E9FE|nr:hypothetical protein [Nocardia tenerifensis]